MRVLYTDDALSDLDHAYEFINARWPEVLDAFEDRLSAIEHLVSDHPEGGHTVPRRRGVRAVPFVHYPYTFIYRIRASYVEVLRIYNTSQRPW